MQESFFSPSWYRVSNLRPRLRGHTQIHRHHYRGVLWYVLQDHVTGRFYRFSSVVYQFIGMMNGRLTIHELWDKTAERFGDDAPTQGDIVRLLTQLHSADALICDVPPDTEELFRRHQKIKHGQLKQKLTNPLSIKIPLVDPERFLTATSPFISPMFSLVGAIIWLTVIGSAIVLGFQHWPELTANMADRVLSVKNLMLLWLIFPFIKALHELGHGYAVKAWGGEVHEVGIMFLVMMPIPYVDASSASAFRERRRRVVVGAGGIIVELFIAALALFLWINVEQGVVRSIAYNIVLISSISTLIFNGNPLLRYDGYYILADLVEIPNLAQRGMNYLGYLFKQYVFGVQVFDPPHTSQGERIWLVTYTITSFIYRIFVYAAIILFISSKFFAFGILLGLWAFFNMVISPFFKRIHFIMFSPVLREKRHRAVLVTSVFMLAVIAGLFFLPVPLLTQSEGVVWVPNEALVRAGTNGFITQVIATPNSLVEKGEVLIKCHDPFQESNVTIQQARLRELEVRYNIEILKDRVQAEITHEEIEYAQANLKRATEQLSDLLICSPSSGLFILPGASDLLGIHLKKGDLIAYVSNIDKPTIRVVVDQDVVDLVRRRTNNIEVRLSERLAVTFDATIQSEVPGAIERLPSTILGIAGGGAIPIDPRDQAGLKPFEKLFQFDLKLTQSVQDVKLGGRAYVRFDHGYEPLAYQWYRSLRQLFLRRFNV